MEGREKTKTPKKLREGGEGRMCSGVRDLSQDPLGTNSETPLI